MRRKFYHVEGNAKVISIIEGKSTSMVTHILNHTTSYFTLWYKDIKHSDLISSGKRTKVDQDFDKNILYYLTAEEMRTIEKNSKKPFETAHQSNIGMCEDFYEDLGVSRLERRKGKQTTQHNHIRLNDFVNVFLVNDTVKYFTKRYTDIVVTNLGKKPIAINESEIKLKYGAFTPMQLTQAIHGLGTADDKMFHEYRKTIFMNDRLYFIIEHNREGNKLYVMMEKNPVFFRLAGVANDSWAKHLEIESKQQDAKVGAAKKLDDKEKSRKQQSTWKKMLAQEMMNYTTHEGEVFCPLTKIRGAYDDIHMLFIASHIKRFEHCKPNEAYDINNGLLLCANADALFDKHMITVNENKKLVFSYLIDNEYQLKSELLLNQPIFEMILNEERMKYMKEHRAIFEEKEKKRKFGNVDDEYEYDDTSSDIVNDEYEDSPKYSIPFEPLVPAAEDFPSYNVQSQPLSYDNQFNTTERSYEISRTKVNQMTDEVLEELYEYDHEHHILPQYKKSQLEDYIMRGKALSFKMKLSFWYDMSKLNKSWN